MSTPLPSQHDSTFSADTLTARQCMTFTFKKDTKCYTLLCLNNNTSKTFCYADRFFCQDFIWIIMTQALQKSVPILANCYKFSHVASVTAVFPGAVTV